LGTDLATTATRALARSVVLGLCSQALTYPTAGAVADLLEEDLPLALALAGAMPPEVAAALETLARALEGETAESLEDAFRERFSHVHPRDCPLYETDHRAREVWRQTQVLADLGGFYRAFGLEESGERGDHVSVELEFLHVLAYKTAWALERGEAEHAERCEAAARAFLAEHVLRWLPDVAERLRVVGRGSPYEAVGALLAAVLRAEAERTGLAVTVEAPVGPVEPGGPEDIALCEEPA
jgi:DMSO reductase family type II enzyme chaperone